MSVAPVQCRPATDRRVAFEALFEAELPYVVRTLRRLGVAERDVEDLGHEVFITVYRRLDDYDTSRPIRPWLFGISYRVAVGYSRLARHRFELVGGNARSDADAAGAVAPLEARELVMKALGKLSLEQRALFVMHDLDGLAVPDIANALEVPLNTAYSRLRAARRDFKAAVLRLERVGGAA